MKSQFIPDHVMEIARDGRVVWDDEIEGQPTTTQRLDNGNTVVIRNVRPHVDWELEK